MANDPPKAFSAGSERTNETPFALIGGRKMFFYVRERVKVPLFVSKDVREIISDVRKGIKAPPIVLKDVREMFFAVRKIISKVREMAFYPISVGGDLPAGERIVVFPFVG